MTACTSPLRTVEVDAVEDLLAADAGLAGPRSRRRGHQPRTAGGDHHVAVVARTASYTGTGCGGRQRAAARRSRARRCCRASSTRSRARRGSTSPSRQRDVGVAAAVADGVDVVADAHDGDRRAADLDPPGRARRELVERARPSTVVRSVTPRSSVASLSAMLVAQLRPPDRPTGSCSSTSSKKPEHDRAARPSRAARRGSRGRSAAPRRSGPTAEAWLQRTSLFSISRLGTDSAHAPSRELQVAVGLEGVGARAPPSGPG